MCTADSQSEKTEFQKTVIAKVSTAIAFYLWVQEGKDFSRIAQMLQASPPAKTLGTVSLFSLLLLCESRKLINECMSKQVVSIKHYNS